MSDMYEYFISCLINDSNIRKWRSLEVLEIYFNQKSIEDKERILRDSAFGC